MALTDLTDREAMAVMLGCTADDVRRARELYQKNKEKGIVPLVPPVTEFINSVFSRETEKYVRLSTENYIKGTATVTKPPIPPEQEKEIRTDMQRRFDAIAEEVLYGGSLPVRGAKPKP